MVFVCCSTGCTCQRLQLVTTVQMFYKKCQVQHVPVGVVASIVPWNYPFHNVFNPLLAALFAGNALVIKVSEHASWSAQFYQRLVDAALAAAGAPPGLVQILTGTILLPQPELLIQCACGPVDNTHAHTVGRAAVRNFDGMRSEETTRNTCAALCLHYQPAEAS